jgi:hypothetical protein
VNGVSTIHLSQLNGLTATEIWNVDSLRRHFNRPKFELLYEAKLVGILML